MADLIELLAPLVLHWRVGVATSIALFVTAVMSATLVSFTGLFGLGVVLLGFGAGMLWEADASKAKGKGKVD